MIIGSGLGISFVFLILAALHFSWALGSAWGFEQALPTKENGERILNPTKADCAIVGLSLLLFAFFYLVKVDWVEILLPGVIQTLGGWIISLIFILRAIGDFRYVGFFKRIRNTTFGRLDTWYYSPLCTGIGVCGLLIEFMSTTR